jgi:hypothetical protein
MRFCITGGANILFRLKKLLPDVMDCRQEYNQSKFDQFYGTCALQIINDSIVSCYNTFIATFTRHVKLGTKSEYYVDSINIIV